MTMFQRVWLEWKDDYLTKVRAESERQEAQWRRGDMITDKPSACTSAHLIEELRVYVSMKQGQAAWGTHQANIQHNLLKTLGSQSGRRQAMPAVSKNEKKDTHSKDDKTHGKSEPARRDTAAPAARQRQRDGRDKDRSRDRDRRASSRGREKARDHSDGRKSDRSSSRTKRSSSKTTGRRRSSRSKNAHKAMPAVGKQNGKMGCCYREYMHKKDKAEGGTNKYPRCIFGKGCRFCHNTQPDQDLLKKWEEKPPLTHDQLANPPKLVAAPAKERGAARNAPRTRKPRTPSGSSRSNQSSRTHSSASGSSPSRSSASGSSTSSRSSRSDRSGRRGHHGHKSKGSPARKHKESRSRGHRRSPSRPRKGTRGWRDE